MDEFKVSVGYGSIMKLNFSLAKCHSSIRLCFKEYFIIYSYLYIFDYFLIIPKKMRREN